MMIPDPVVLDRLIQDRQRDLRVTSRRIHGRRPGGLRVRVGHLLIAAGSSLSGERVEPTARPRTLSRAA